MSLAGRLHWRRLDAILILVALIALLSCALLWWGSRSWEETFASHVPAADNLHRASSFSARAYLLQLEYRGTPSWTKRQEILGLLENAQIAAADAANARSSLFGVPALPLSRPLGAQLTRFRDAVDAFSRVSLLQLQSGQVSAIGALERRNAYAEVERLGAAIESQLQLGLTTGVEHQRRAQGWSLALWLMFLLAASVVLWRAARTEAESQALLASEQRALTASERRLRMALEAASAGVWEWELAGGRGMWSEEAWDLFGLPRGSCEPSYRTWRQSVRPEDLPALEASVERAVAAEREFELEWRPAGAGGSEERWVLSRGKPQWDDEGRLTGYLGIIMDISARKRAEQALRESEARMEAEVAERTAELVAARNEAERLARAKTDFLANMSHEVRTPLSAVVGLARIGEREASGTSRQTFGRIMAAGEHLLHVVNDILDFSKIEAGRLSLDRQPFELVDVIRSAGTLLAESARQKGLAYHIQCAPTLPEWVLGDPQRLQQILVNLLSNAVKFTERGEVGLSAESDGRGILIEVWDTGIGMSADQVARLFQPFEQADGSTTRKYGGTGLGLAISRNLTQMMEGELRVESRPGAGSTFSLALPLPPTEPNPRPRLSRQWAPGPALGGVRVLAAEDMEVNRLILEDLLMQEGAELTFVENGREAVGRVESGGSQAFDVVLMDVQMPEMDGYEATRRIRRIAPALPVIGLTAHALPEERERSLAAGMVDHVTKPIDPVVLTRTIRHHLASVSPPAAQTTEARADVQVEPVVEVEGVIDWGALQRRYRGRTSFIARLVATALASNVSVPDDLMTAVERKDLEKIRFIAHNLKGVSGNLEARSLHAIAKATESAARSAQSDVFGLATDLARQARGLLSELRDFSEAAEATTPGAGENA